MSEVIVITSGKGRCGQDNHHSQRRNRSGKAGPESSSVDTDIGLRNLDVVMGLENRIVYNLVDVVEGNCRSSRH